MALVPFLPSKIPKRPYRLTDYESHMAFRRAKVITEAIGIGDPDTPVNAAMLEYVESLCLSQENRITYSGASPDRKYRTKLVILILHIGEKLRLQDATVFRAVYLLDRFMGQHCIGKTQLEMVAVTCIIISSKIEEVPDRTPNLKKLRCFFSNDSICSSRLFVDVERYILKFFNFFVMVPTEVEFFDVLSLYAVDEIRHDQDSRSMLSGEFKVFFERICDHHIKRFSALALQQLEYGDGLDLSHFDDAPGSRIVAESIVGWGKTALRDLLMEEPPTDSQWTPSLIAASVLLNARIVNGLPTWTETLHFVSTHSSEEVWKCFCSFVLPTLYCANSEKYKMELITVYETIPSNSCNSTCVLYKGSDYSGNSGTKSPALTKSKVEDTDKNNNTLRNETFPSY